MGGMTAIRHHILPWLLSLLIALTGQAAAVAHAAPGPSGQIELCTGSGPVMVYVDANGTPVGDPVYCPDFALSLILALDLAPVVPGSVEGLSEVSVPVVRATAMSGRDVRHRLARGPPSVI